MHYSQSGQKNLINLLLTMKKKPKISRSLKKKLYTSFTNKREKEETYSPFSNSLLLQDASSKLGLVQK